jgi:multiple sugar transport system permease protein
MFTTDTDFIIAFTNTIKFAVFTAVFALLLAFFVSFLMNRTNLAGKALIQSLFFVPVVISVVPSAIIWKWIYDPQFGVLNYIIDFIGIQPIGWLVDKNYSMMSVIIYVVWKWMGYYMIIFLVGFSNIPDDYIQAARIDGATGFQVLWRIILPLLAPIIYFASVMATIKGFTIFSEVYVMTSGSQGAPGNMVKVLTYDIYERGFFFGKIGEANAEAVVLFVLLLVLTIIQMQINKRVEYYKG